MKKSPHTRMHNDVLEALCTASLPGSHYQIVLFVSRRTHGFQKSRMRMSRRIMAQKLGLASRTVDRSFQDLVDRKIIEVHENGTGNKASEFGINGNVSEWICADQNVGINAGQDDGKVMPTQMSAKRVKNVGINAGQDDVYPPTGMSAQENSICAEKRDNQAARELSQKTPKENVLKKERKLFKERDEDFVGDSGSEPEEPQRDLRSITWLVSHRHGITQAECVEEAEKFFFETFTRQVSVRERERLRSTILSATKCPAASLATWLASVRRCQSRRLSDRANGKQVLSHVLTDCFNEFADVLEEAKVRHQRPREPQYENWSAQARERKAREQAVAQ